MYHLSTLHIKVVIMNQSRFFVSTKIKVICQVMQIIFAQLYDFKSFQIVEKDAKTFDRLLVVVP